MDREDAAAHNLGDETGGVVGQGKPQRQIFGTQNETAFEIEAFQLWEIEGNRHAADEERNDRKTDNQSDASPEYRKNLSGRDLARLGPALDEYACPDGYNQGHENQPGALLENGLRCIEAAIRQEE